MPGRRPPPFRRRTPLPAPAALCLGLAFGLVPATATWAGTATVSVDSGSVNEGNSGTTTLNVPVTRADDTTSNLVIEYQTDIGDTNPATPGVDYIAKPAGSLVRIPAGESGTNIGVTVLGDTLPEDHQTLLVQLTRAVAFSPTVSFTTAFNYASGTNPIAVALGDLDGDGRLDYAVANTAGVTVRRGGSTPGAISFAQAQGFSAGFGPLSIAIGDLDGDGKPDVAVANHTADTVSVLRNTSSTGAISFASAVALAVGDGPYGIAIDDLDGDGRRDLVSANYNAGTVSILRNTSNPGALGFAEATSASAGTSPSAVAIADIDGDNKPDLAVANRGSGNVSVLHGSSSSGSISFDATTHFSTGALGAAPRAIALGDIDGDGKADLVVANESEDTAAVLRNTSSSGTPGFAAAVAFSVGDLPYSVSIGDLDGNGKPDLAVANYVGGNVSVLLNSSSIGSVGFAAASAVTAGTNPAAAAVVDIDGDGKPDLAVANYGSHSLSTLRNSPGLDAALGSNEGVGTITNDDAGTPAAPTLTLEVSPATIDRGDSATLTWSSDDATACTASGAWSGAEALNGSLEVTPSTGGTHTYTLTCTNSGGSVARSAVLTVTTPEPTIEISVSPSSIDVGTGATLSWSSTDALTCTASGAWGGARATSGSITVTPETAGTHTYTLDCDGPGGSVEDAASLTVTAPTPAVAISVAPTSIVQGATAKLTWSSQNVTGCTASGDWGGTKPLNGSIPLKPAAGVYTYTLGCTGAGGDVSASAILTVTPPPPPSTPFLKLAVLPTSITVGQSAALTWSSSGLTGCTASGAWTGARDTRGTATTTPSTPGTYTYRLTCQAPGGTKTIAVTLTVGNTAARPTVNLKLSPASIDVGGGSAALSWSTLNASGCTASGAWTGPRDPSGGNLFVQPPKPGTYTYTLSCSGSGGTTVKSVTLTVTRRAPAMGLSILPTRAIVGRPVTLTWSALYASACTAGGAWSGSKIVGGTENRTAPAQPGIYTYTLTCTGAGGTARKSVELTVVREPLPVVNFFVTPTTMKLGNSAELTWSTTNASSCAASGAWGPAPRPTTGEETISPSAIGTYTYTLSCTGPGGTVAKSARLSVTAPLPTVDFSVSPGAVFVGEPASLAWSSTFASSCSASGAWSGSKPVDGDQTVSRSAVGSYIYKLACTGAGGTTTKSVTLTVASALTYSGPFAVGGNFSASYPEYGTTCTWRDDFTGTAEWTITPGPGGTYTGTVHVLGNFNSVRVSGGNANFTCLNGSNSWDDEHSISGTSPNANWTTAFNTPFGRPVSGVFTGTRSGDEVTGTLRFTIESTSWESGVTLTRQ